MSRKTFRIGDWVVEPNLNRLVKKRQYEQLEPRLMNLLVLLAENPRELVSKDHIFETIWSGLVVTDESLSQAISKLRKILGDDPENPKYIETIRKKGYRLLIEVEAYQDKGLAKTKGVVLFFLAFLALLIGYTTYFGLNQTTPEPYSAFSSRPLTSSAGREKDPSISSDGKFVVYSKTLPSIGEQIFIHGIDRGSQDRQLTTRGQNFSPLFKPSENEIIFLRKGGGDCKVIEMALADSSERVLASCEGNEYPDLAISQDGNTIAFSAKQSEGANGINIVNLENGERSIITTPSEKIWGDYDPVFIDDGEMIAFSRSVSEGMQDLFVVSLKNQVEQQLTDDSRNIMGLAQFGEEIIYASNIMGRYDLWALNYKSKAKRRLPILGTGLINPTFSVLGNKLVFESINRASKLVKLTLNSSGEEIISFNAELLHPNISTKEGRVLFTSNRSGFYEIWDVDGKGENLRRLTNFSSGFTAHPKISPDEKRIAFDARPEGFSRIYIMGNDGEAITPLSPEFLNSYSPSWSNDGNSIYYSSEVDNRLEIFKLNLETTEQTQFTFSGGFYGQEHEGGYFYFVKPKENGIWRKEFETAANEEKIIENLDFADWGTWGIYNNNLYYFDRGRQSLMAYDLNTNQVKMISTFKERVTSSDPALAIDPNSGEIYMTFRKWLEGDLEMVEIPSGK